MKLNIIHDYRKWRSQKAVALAAEKNQAAAAAAAAAMAALCTVTVSCHEWGENYRKPSNRSPTLTPVVNDDDEDDDDEPLGAIVSPLVD